MLTCIVSSELLDPVTNGFLPTRFGGAVGLPQHMLLEPAKGETIDLKTLQVKTNYNRWFKGFRIPETIRCFF